MDNEDPRKECNFSAPEMPRLEMPTLEQQERDLAIDEKHYTEEILCYDLQSTILRCEAALLDAQSDAKAHEADVMQRNSDDLATRLGEVRTKRAAIAVLS